MRKNRDISIRNADDSFDKKHSVFYLESALKNAQRRQDNDKTKKKR